jgi:SAM-dependent methyltransferase
VKTYALRACPSCGGTGAEEIVLGDREGETLRRCTACALVYAREFGDPSEIYVDGYLVGGTDFGLDVMHPQFQEFLAHAADVRLRALERIVGPPGSLLDVGCGTGEVLGVAKLRGWRGVGVEPVAESVEIARARGVEVRHAMLEKSDLEQGSFDVVSAFHVLEHMSEGTAFLRSIARWARPGGHVLIEVPNWRGFHRRSSGADWPSLRPLEHIAHYSPKTLASTFARAGLEPVKVRTLGFLWDQQTLPQALADIGGLRWQSRMRVLSRPGVHKGEPATYPSKAGWALLRSVQRAYDLAGVGQVVFGVARAPG